MKDWKGNEIKAGQTIIKIQIKGMFDECEFTPRFGKQRKPFTTKRSYLWNIVNECKIVKKERTHKFTKGVWNVSLDFIDFYMGKQPYEIICIKGISDKKEDYYSKEIIEKHFKTSCNT